MNGNWWESAPLAQQPSVGSKSNGNWWESAPLAQKEPQKPSMGTGEDIGRSFLTGVVKGIPNTMDLAASGVATLIDKEAGHLKNIFSKEPVKEKGWGETFSQYAGQRNFSKGLDNLLGTEEHVPQTKVGEYANYAGQAVGTLPLAGAKAALQPLNVTRAATAGVTGGVGSDVGRPVGGYIAEIAGGPEWRKTGENVGALAGAAGGAYYGDKKIGEFAKGFQSTAPLKTPDADEFKEAARVSYEKADSLGGTLDPAITNKFVNDINSTLKPQTVAGKAILGESEGVKLADRVTKELTNKPLTLQAAQEIDEGLGQIIDNMTVLGKVNKEGNKILQIQHALRDTIEGAPANMISGGKEGFEALKEARQLWRQQAKMRDIERIIEKASQMDVPATGLRTGFRTLSNNPQRMRGFSPDEVAAIKHAAKHGILTGTLKLAGSRLVPIASAAAGSAAGGGFLGGIAGGAVGEAVSLPARNAASALQGMRANKVLETIARGGKVPTMAEKAGMQLRDLFGSAPTSLPKAPPMGPAQGLVPPVPMVPPSTPPVSGGGSMNQAMPVQGSFLDKLGESIKKSDQRGSLTLPWQQADGLPMDTESRLARAKAMGFDTENPVYHGTQYEIDSFNNDTAKKLGVSSGLGTWVSTDAKTAGTYAPQRGGNIMPLNLRGKENFVIVEGNGRLWKDLVDDTKIVTPHGGRITEADKKLFDDLGIVSKAGDLKTRGSKTFTSADIGLHSGMGVKATDRIARWAKENGHDGVIFKDVIDSGPYSGGNLKPSTNMIIFDPKNIRSVNAKFDPANSESANLLASRPEAGIAAGVLAGGVGLGDFASDKAVPRQPNENLTFNNESNARYEPFQEMPEMEKVGVSNPVSRTFAISEEGVRNASYKDSRGFRTVGIGFNMDQNGARSFWKQAGIKENFDAVYNGRQKISNQSAEKLFELKHDRASKIAQKLVPSYESLGENQQAALDSMVYQMGPAGAKAFKRTLNALKDGHAKVVMDGVLQSRWAKQTPARAKRTALMLAFNMAPHEAEAVMVNAGQIKQNERKYGGQ